jgi:hypothetical protein
MKAIEFITWLVILALAAFIAWFWGTVVGLLLWCGLWLFANPASLRVIAFGAVGLAALVLLRGMVRRSTKGG